MSSGAEQKGSPSTPSAPGVTTTAPPEVTEERLPDPEGWATRRELVWLEEYGHWAQPIRSTGEALLAFAGEADELGEEAAVDELERLMGPLASCLEDFRRLVPSAPTQRLLEAAELTEAACGHYARGSRALIQALREDEDVNDPAALQEFERARSTFALLNEKLPPGEAQRRPILDGKAARSHVNPRYGRAAAAQVEKLVEARCWAGRDWRRLLREATLAPGAPLRVGDTGGYTGIGSRRVNLAPQVCAALDRLTYDGARPLDWNGRLAMSFVVGVLAHEAHHRAGVFDEAVAECYGMQSLSETAQALGVSRPYAEMLAQLAWETYDQLEPGYRSPECRKGGALDLDRPGRGAWP
jgi:hypothetical protein